MYAYLNTAAKEKTPVAVVRSFAGASPGELLPLAAPGCAPPPCRAAQNSTMGPAFGFLAAQLLESAGNPGPQLGLRAWGTTNGTGADSIGARYYNSALGRFMTPDWSAAPVAVPYANLENPQTLNLYSYVLNNPVTATDAEGHWCQQAVGCHAPANLTYKSGIPPATGKLENLFECTAECTGVPTVVTSTTSDQKLHPAGTPHAKGDAADVRVPKGTEEETLRCAASCGAQFGQNERSNPSAHSTGPHVHLQTTPGVHGGRGDLPKPQPTKPQKPRPDSDGGLVLMVSYTGLGPVCKPQLPIAIRQAVLSKFPNSRVVTVAGMRPDDRHLWLSARPGLCPGAAVAKYDGHRTMYAVNLVRGSGAQQEQALVVAVGAQHGIRVMTVSNWGAMGNSIVVYTLPPGTYQEAGGGRTIRTHVPVIAMEAIEAGTIIFYWRNGAFHQLTISE